MTTYVRRTVLPDASAGAVDRAMTTLGLSGVRRDKGVRTTIPAKDGARAGDLLDRDFTAVTPNLVRVTNFTYVRTWAGFVSSEDAAVMVGVSAPVGARWFRHGGGMPPISLTEPTGRYLSFAEREEIAILVAQGQGRAADRPRPGSGRGHDLA